MSWTAVVTPARRYPGIWGALFSRALRCSTVLQNNAEAVARCQNGVYDVVFWEQKVSGSNQPKFHTYREQRTLATIKTNCAFAIATVGKNYHFLQNVEKKNKFIGTNNCNISMLRKQIFRCKWPERRYCRWLHWFTAQLYSGSRSRM